MKKRNWVKLLERNGWKFVRHDGNHDIYTKDSQTEYVPRHAELDEQLARAIIRRRNLK